MASWTWVISDGKHLTVTREEDKAWTAGRRPGAAVIAIPMIDLPVAVEPDPPVELDREQLGKELDAPRKLVWD